MEQKKYLIRIQMNSREIISRILIASNLMLIIKIIKKVLVAKYKVQLQKLIFISKLIRIQRFIRRYNMIKKVFIFSISKKNHLFTKLQTRWKEHLYKRHLDQSSFKIKQLLILNDLKSRIKLDLYLKAVQLRKI